MDRLVIPGPPSRRGLAYTLVVSTALGAGCSEGARAPVAPAASPVAAIVVSPDTASMSLEAGGTVHLSATVLDSAGQPLPGYTVSWGSLQPARAIVDANGTVTAVGSGPAQILASVAGKSDTATIRIVSTPSIEACKLPRLFGRSVAFGFPKPPERLRSVDTVRATVLFVDFADAPATRTPAEVLGIIDPIAPDYFSAVSYGAMTLVLQPTLQWFRMSRESTTYGWPNAITYNNHLALLQEAATLAAAATDYSQTDLLVVMTNPDAGAINNGPALTANTGFGVTVPGRAMPIANATNSGRDLLYWGGTWLNHEVGHLLSLPDLYQYSSAAAHQHVGEWSLMGLISGRGREFSAFERWQLGWLQDDQLLCAPTGTSDVTLSPIEIAGGLKAVIVPLGPGRAVVVESRRALGFDADLTQPGPLAYLIDTNVASGQGTMRVLPMNDGDQSKITRTLLTTSGVNFEDVAISLLSQSATGDVVRVIRP